MRAEGAQPFADDGVAAPKTQPAQLFMQAHRRQGVALQQLRDMVGEPPPAGIRSGSR
jgi:hypothetical protein